ncbi:MAG TPA: MBOAT family O-acyltransferase [Methylomirabilota bacterium]|nr:MBOAT family O-acyltransferase [Methylomirabilota bacterium]
MQTGAVRFRRSAVRLSSQTFLLGFLPLALAVYWLVLRDPIWRRRWLLVASYGFYAWFDWRFLWLLAGLSGVTHLAATGVARETSRAGRRWWLLGGVAGNLVALALFKYYDFAATSVNALVAWLERSPRMPLLETVLPLGISYFTFQAISYIADVHQGRVQPPARWEVVATYLALFPQISSGPIVRYPELAEPLAAPPPRARREDMEQGFLRIIVGLTKKVVVADPLGVLVTLLVGQHATLQVAGGWLVAAGFGLQLYFDFSAYTDIAVGVARLFGFRYPENFDAPYRAQSPPDFWNRWHMSLSRWIRDYVFLPFGRFLLVRAGSRHAFGAQSAALIVTMTLIGLWHGARWGFVLFGLWHGLLMVAHHVGRALRLPGLPPWLAQVVTWLGVTVAWPLLGCPSLGVSWAVYQAMLGFRGVEPSLAAVPAVTGGSLVVLLAALSAAVAGWEFRETRFPRSWVGAAALGALGAACLVLARQASPFLYAGF